MRLLVSAGSAAITALLVGTLIGTVSSSAHATALAKAYEAQDRAHAAAIADEQTAAELAAYHARLQDALTKLDAAYRELQARDAAYRDLLARSQRDVATLSASNRALEQRVDALTTMLSQSTTVTSTNLTRSRGDDGD